MLELYLQSPTHLNGVVLDFLSSLCNYLSLEVTLPVDTSACVGILLLLVLQLRLRRVCENATVRFLIHLALGSSISFRYMGLWLYGI